MKTLQFIALCVVALFFVENSDAQNNNVGIGTTTPLSSAMLDVTSTTKGVLVPRVTTSQMNGISSPANGLMVYNTDSSCFFYYKISSWTSLCMAGGAGGVGATGPTGPAGTNGIAGPTGPAGANGAAGSTGPTGTNGTAGVTGPTGPSQTAWWILGNSGTTAGTNFIGTTDAQDFITKTNGSLAANERIRTLVGGQTVLNCTTIQAGDVFSVYGTGYTGAINALGSIAIGGYVSGSNPAIFGENLGSGAGVVGESATGIGVYGQSNSPTVAGVTGKSINTTGTGVWAIGNNAVNSLISGGSGLSANGTDFGIFSLAYDVPGGTGVAGVGNDVATVQTLTTGSGIAGTGFQTGVYGAASSTTSGTNRTGGYFATASNGSFANVGFIDNTNFAWKINGNGANGTLVKDLNNQYVAMVSPESPEVLLMDYGKAKLTNGTAHVNIDPVFSKNITVNDQHELRVFIQLEGDCKGVFVTGKTQTGFNVTELQGGKSNVEFSWQIVANRADEVLPDGTLSRNSSFRFNPSSGPLKAESVKTIRTEFKGREKQK